MCQYLFIADIKVRFITRFIDLLGRTGTSISNHLILFYQNLPRRTFFMTCQGSINREIGCIGKEMMKRGGYRVIIILVVALIKNGIFGSL